MIPNDAPARRAAIDGSRSFIVQAPAGSGKTTLLIQRLLVLLATVEAPEEVVAITFTRKAAAEMRSRLVEALRRAAEGEPESEGNAALTHQLARAVLERDALLGWGLLANAGRLRLMTIDSLCGWLARQLPIASGLGRVPALRDDASELYAEAARATLSLLDDGLPEQAAAVRGLLVHLDNQQGTAVALLSSMLAKRDQWMRLIGGAHEREALEAALAQVRREGFAAAVDGAERAPDEFWRLAAWAAAQREAAGEAGGACLDLQAWPDLDQEAVWLALAELWLTQSGEWRKQVNVKQGFAAPSSVKDAELKAQLAAAKDEAKQLLESLATPEFEALRVALSALSDLPPSEYRDSQWQVLADIVQVLKLAVAQLALVFSERGEADFAEVARGALAALEGQEGEAASDLAVALDARIRHLLVDEFQDTSLTQFRLLELLTQGWSPGDGRSLFLVGDPMQSIYRFREADVGLFLRARAEGLGGLPLEPLVLSANFRSQAGVVDWVNQAFARVLPEVEDITAGAVAYSPAQAARPALPGVAVQIHARAKSTAAAQQEADDVVEVVRSTWSEDPEASVAVLVRGRSHLTAIVPALRAAGLACVAVEIDALASRPVIQDLYALTRALLHPADRAAWLAVLRAPWCGLSLADLEALAGAGRTPIEICALDPERLSRVSNEGRERLVRLMRALSPWLEKRRRTSLAELVEGAWVALGGPACHSEQAALDDSLSWFELVADLESAAQIEDGEILARELESLFAAPEPVAGNAVQLMTIHKSKGLEFDTVIVPGLERSTRGADSRLLAWLERAGSGGQGELLLAPLREAGQKSEPTYDYIARLQARRERLEAGRLLYVAATRAKRRLHLMGAARVVERGADVEVKPPAGDSLLAQLWPAVEAEFAGIEAVPEAEAQEVEREPARLRRLPLDWASPLAEPALGKPGGGAPLASFSWEADSARHVGTVVHAWLQRMSRGLAHWDEARIEGLASRLARELAQLGVPESLRPFAAARVQSALKACLADPRGRWVLGEHCEAQSEWRLAFGQAGAWQQAAIDRSFVDDAGVRWVVDYKTSRPEGEAEADFLARETERYRPQLEAYARLVQALEPGREIRLALYFPLVPAWREWRPGEAVPV